MSRAHFIGFIELSAKDLRPNKLHHTFLLFNWVEIVLKQIVKYLKSNLEELAELHNMIMSFLTYIPMDIRLNQAFRMLHRLRYQIHLSANYTSPASLRDKKIFAKIADTFGTYVLGEFYIPGQPVPVERDKNF